MKAKDFFIPIFFSPVFFSVSWPPIDRRAKHIIIYNYSTSSSATMNMVIYSPFPSVQYFTSRNSFRAAAKPYFQWHSIFTALKAISPPSEQFCTSLRPKSWSVSLACHATSTPCRGNFLPTHQADAPSIALSYPHQLYFPIFLSLFKPRNITRRNVRLGDEVS